MTGTIEEKSAALNKALDYIRDNFKEGDLEELRRKCDLVNELLSNRTDGLYSDFYEYLLKTDLDYECWFPLIVRGIDSVMGIARYLDDLDKANLGTELLEIDKDKASEIADLIDDLELQENPLAQHRGGGI